ncbi:hypothetical protein [Desulfurococcus mucosus]|nr:hypothetical protein [Desulfurococcus mucosus]
MKTRFKHTLIPAAASVENTAENYSLQPIDTYSLRQASRVAGTEPWTR